MRLSKTIDRPAYLKKLWAWKDDRLIKAVVGPRRSGKSVLLSLYRNQLRQSGVAPENIIAFNLEDYAQLALTDPSALHEAVLGAASDPRQQYYVFIDEVQACREFERVGSSLALRENINLYITGSNAMLLSGGPGNATFGAVCQHRNDAALICRVPFRRGCGWAFLRRGFPQIPECRRIPCGRAVP